MNVYYHRFWNRSWQCLEMRRATSANAQPESLGVQWQYVWSARYVDAALLRDRNRDGNSQTGDLGKPGSGLEERFYYLGDANFNVTCLIGTDGDPLEHYLYDPYGKLTIYTPNWASPQGTSSYGPQHYYTGRKYDGTTRLYHYRHRHYHAELGRFLSRDPIGYEAGNPNLYWYVHNRPSCAADSSGLTPIICGCRAIRNGRYFYGDVSADWISGTVGSTCEAACRGTEFQRRHLPRDTAWLGWSGKWRYKRTIPPGWLPTVKELCQGVEKDECCKESKCTQQECEQTIKSLIRAAKNTTVSEGADQCYRWVDAFSEAAGAQGHCVRRMKTLFITHVPTRPGGWISDGILWERHCAVKVKICNGKEFYIDNGWLGGDDNFFAPEEIPGPGRILPGYEIVGQY